ncbi:MAG TPA: trypsin-like peptidase domain-containing protein [Longimicrobiaceae bacterium]
MRTHPLRSLAGATSVALLCATSLSGQARSAPLVVRAAIISEDLSVRPIPHLPLYVISGTDTARVETDLDGSASISLTPGTYRVVSTAPLRFSGSDLVWDTPVELAAGGGKVEISNRNARTPANGPSAAASAARPAGRRVSEEAAIFERVRSGVFTVWGEEGKGSGFLVDATGVVLTNAHVVQGSSEVRVQVNDETKVRAKILHVDKDRDVAALLIPAARCASCVVLKLADASAGPIAVTGERVLAIGSPLNQTGVMTLGIVSKLEERAIISDVNINHGNSGGPLLNGAGEVIAINTFGDFTDQGGPGISGSILITQAEPTLAEARARLAAGERAPADSLLPNAPRDPFPLDAIKAVAAAPRFDLRPYSGSATGFDYVLMTPLSMAWRAAKASEALLARRRQRETRAGVGENERVDPMQNWPGWDEYIGGRKAVVAFHVVPKVAETRASGWANALGAVAAGMAGTTYAGNYDLEFKGDFREMKLLRDGVEVIPVDRNRSPAVLDVQTWTARGKDYAYQGIYVYRPEDFAPKEDGTFATYTVTISDARKPERPVQFTLAPRTVQAIWKDFGSYMGAQQGSP